MQASDIPLAVAAARSIASELGLRVDDAVVLHASNRIAVRLLPCDVLARVAYVAHQAGAAFEVEVARRLAETDSPVAALEPRVEPRDYVRDGFVVTLWIYYEPASPRDIAPPEYAQALERLHAGMRQIDVPAPHFTDRVQQAQRLVGNRVHTPELADADRELLSTTLRRLRRVIGDRGAAEASTSLPDRPGASTSLPDRPRASTSLPNRPGASTSLPDRPEQLLHGEPHPGNVLRTKNGLLFIDLETCCRGPVEFDIAHVPDDVGEHYADTDQDLLRECRVLMLAMIIAWRWERDDQLPNGRRLATEWLSQLRAALGRDGQILRTDPER